MLSTSGGMDKGKIRIPYLVKIAIMYLYALTFGFNSFFGKSEPQKGVLIMGMGELKGMSHCLNTFYPCTHLCLHMKHFSI